MSTIKDRWLDGTGQRTALWGTGGGRYVAQFWDNASGVQRKRLFPTLAGAEAWLSGVAPGQTRRERDAEVLAATVRLYTEVAAGLTVEDARWPSAEVAKVLGITTNVVQLRIRRARRAGLLPAEPERRRPEGCMICGVPAPDGRCRVLARHLEWLRLRGGSDASIYSRRRALARMGTALPVPVLEAGAGQLAEWRAAMHLKPATIVAYVCHASEFYKWAITEGHREDNPAAGLPLPRPGRRLPRPIPEADLMRAVEAAPPRIRPMLVLAGWAGLRAKEIALLQRENICDSARPPYLLIAENATKGHAERIVPISAFVLAELAAAQLPGAGYAFRRNDGQRGPNRPWMISHLCNEYLHEAGIPSTLHQLRHRFGTMTYKACRDLRVVQELMGHQNPSTTAGYAAYSTGRASAAVEALDAPARPRPRKPRGPR